MLIRPFRTFHEARCSQIIFYTSRGLWYCYHRKLRVNSVINTANMAARVGRQANVWNT